jgi:hypothetical protein
MPISLRGPDALAVIKHKESLKVGLAASDCVAVLQVGAKTFTAPIFIQKHSGKSVIESDFTFNEARPNTLVSIDGESATILRFEKIPEPVVPPPAPPEPTPQEIFNERMREAREANPGANELSLRLRVTDQLAKEALAERQRSRQGLQDLAAPDRWASFAAGNRKVANQIAARKI